MAIMCTNVRCKYYYGDRCSEYLDKKWIALDSEGRCEHFEAGVCQYEEKEVITTFRACKHLDFNRDNYSCDLVGISDHLGWARIDPEGKVQLCQFCKLRGRLNSPEACIGKQNALCGDYEEAKMRKKR